MIVRPRLHAGLRARAGEPSGFLLQLTVYMDHAGSGRPFWEPRFRARWGAAAGWQVECYFISDDPDARVIASR